MDYTMWKGKQLLVTTILLDLRNPRIPPMSEPLDQRALLAELILHEKIYELAQNIANNGYYPVESLIIVRENDKMIVVEGNRRLAALKLLIAPQAAPEDQVARFQALSNRIDKAAIRKVKVVVAPNREAIAPILMNRHTNVQIERWDTLMQATFYHSLLRDGITIDDLSRQYNIARKDLVEALRLYDMYQVACSLDLPEEVAQIVHNPREFKATTLQRFYERPISQEFLGIKLSSETPDIVGVVDVSEFKKGYKKVVNDVATGKIDSRIIGKTGEVRKYISTFSEQEKPDLSKKDSFTTDTLLRGVSEEVAEVTTKGRLAVRRPKPKQRGLIPSNISCDVNNQRVFAVFNELRTLPVANYPNATAVLLRSLLEMALSHYLDVTRELYVIIEEEKNRLEKKNKPLKRDWHPSLKHMLTYIISPKCNVIQNPNLRKVLDKFVKRSDEFLSHDDLNYFVHNQFYAPSEDSLRNYWAQLEPLFQIILIEPEPN